VHGLQEKALAFPLMRPGFRNIGLLKNLHGFCQGVQFAKVPLMNAAAFSFNGVLSKPCLAANARRGGINPC